MKYFCIILAFCGWGNSFSQIKQHSETKQKPFVQTIAFLTDDSLQGREAGTIGNEKAAVFLEELLKANQIKPYFKSYRDTLVNFERPSSNIIGWIPGNDPKLKKEYFVLGAHYDHIGILHQNGEFDTIANGANDNASGTAVLAELVRYFSKSKSNKRSLLFVFFTAEEKGLLGSYHLAEKLKEQKLPVVAMLNFEMLGVPMDRDFKAYLTGGELSNMKDKMNGYARKNLIGNLDMSTSSQLFRHSDNFPFYKEFRIPSHTLSSFDFNNYNYYHQVKDEMENLDLNHLGDLINEIIPVVEQLVNSNSQEIKLN